MFYEDFWKFNGEETAGVADAASGAGVATVSEIEGELQFPGTDGDTATRCGCYTYAC